MPFFFHRIIIHYFYLAYFLREWTKKKQPYSLCYRWLSRELCLCFIVVSSHDISFLAPLIVQQQFNRYKKNYGYLLEMNRNSFHWSLASPSILKLVFIIIFCCPPLHKWSVFRDRVVHISKCYFRCFDFKWTIKLIALYGTNDQKWIILTSHLTKVPLDKIIAHFGQPTKFFLSTKSHFSASFVHLIISMALI